MIAQNITQSKLFSEEEIVIIHGDTVYFWDDEAMTVGTGTFVSTYAALRGESSPYWGEIVIGVSRALIHETITNPDGSTTIRPNYILLENIWHEMEVNEYYFLA